MKQNLVSKIGMRTLCWAMAFLLGCGGSSSSEKPREVTEAEARLLYGLTPGNCVVYSNNTGGQTIIKIRRDDATISGQTVYARKIVASSGSANDVEQFFAVAGGEIRLRKWVQPELNGYSVRDYPADAAPLFAEVILSEDDDTPALAPGARVESVVTPQLTASGMQPVPGSEERHVWLVVRLEEGVRTATGTASAYFLQHELNRDGAQSINTYRLVPGLGWATYSDGAKEFQSYAARTCTDDGACRDLCNGNSCQELEELCE